MSKSLRFQEPRCVEETSLLNSSLKPRRPLSALSECTSVPVEKAPWYHVIFARADELFTTIGVLEVGPLSCNIVVCPTFLNSTITVCMVAHSCVSFFDVFPLTKEIGQGRLRISFYTFFLFFFFLVSLFISNFIILLSGDVETNLSYIPPGFCQLFRSNIQGLLIWEFGIR